MNLSETLPGQELFHSELPRVPDHELLRSIASGAYGEVWLARNVVGTLRAVKIVRRDQHALAESFEREFKGLQKFEPISRTHEGLVDILTLGLLPDGAGFYYVMELADQAERGPNLVAADVRRLTSAPSASQTIAHDEKSAPSHVGCYIPRTLRAELKSRGALPAAEVIALGLKLTSALAHLHTSGLVHRDVKPSNILFIGGEPKLADAGLVAALDDARSLVGTAGYIAPEGPGTPQADLYALGKVLYEAAFGKDRQEFPALPAYVASRSDHAALLELNAILLKACATDGRERYQSAEEMSAELSLLQCGQSVKRKRTMQKRLAACKKVGPVILLVGVVLITPFFFLNRRSADDLQSPIQEVNELIERGNLAALSTTSDRLDQAWKYFSRAIELDPKFAPAYIGLFQVRLGQWGGVVVNPPADLDSKLRIAATNLIEIAPNLAEAKLASSFLEFLDGHLDKALANAHQASRMRLGSKNGGGLVHGTYGWYLMNAGRTDDALREYQFAERASPANPVIQFHLGQPYFVQRKFDLALAQYQKSIDLEPRQYNAYSSKGSVYEETGDFEKAIEAFEKADLIAGKNEATTKLFYDALRSAFQSGGPHGYWSKRLETVLSKPIPDSHDTAIILARLGRTDEAYAWLDKASQESNAQNLWGDLCWDHNDARFQAIAKKVGMKP